MSLRLLLAPFLVVALVFPFLEKEGLREGPATRSVPRFEPDPYWPKPLPNKWMLDQVAAVFVDSYDHVWISRVQSAGRDLQRTKAVCEFASDFAHIFGPAQIA